MIQQTPVWSAQRKNQFIKGVGVYTIVPILYGFHLLDGKDYRMNELGYNRKFFIKQLVFP
ncbi:MAG: hypothetical protein IKO93_00255 [Lentisphaeria bacterium]|nr:hypothetical protein [Lentisphaeria bacterium]